MSAISKPIEIEESKEEEVVTRIGVSNTDADGAA